MKYFTLIAMFISLTMSTPAMAEEHLIKITATSWMEEITLEYRMYHVRYSGPPVVDDFSLFGRIYTVEGVQIISSQPHAIGVGKSKVYTWDEVQAEIIRVIQEFERLKAAETNDEDDDEPENMTPKTKI